jgi:RHS repeat-associated protein
MQNSLWRNISYQYDQANRLLQAGDISYTWDANGNQLQKITPQGSWSYVYDYENRLVKVIHPDGGMTEFAYAGAGYDRVWMRKKNGEEIFFTYDGEKTTAEFSAQGALLRAYRYGPQVVWMEEGGNIFFLHADGQGSVRLVTNLSGQVVAEYSYDAFGNQLEGEEGWNPFKYCGIFGYREDEETALMKVGARYYDPTIGRWIQKDPILDGFNWWLYCENDPVNGVDPLGQESFIEAGILVCVAGVLLGGLSGGIIAGVGLTIVFYEVVMLIREDIKAYEERKEWEETPSYQDMGIPPWAKKFLVQ